MHILRKILITSILGLLILPFSSYAATEPVKPIKILIVPGHDNNVWGAQYGNVKEADMNLALAKELYNNLKKDKRFEVYITREGAGEYTKEFAEYFEKERDQIVAFKENAKVLRQQALALGAITQKKNVPHNSVSQDTSVILYGINKWANDNKMDAVVHIHFNDHPRKSVWAQGKYKGFAIYMPEGQMVNSDHSQDFAYKIFSELRKKYLTSTYKAEEGGFIEEQNLIAIGANDTLEKSVRSILIEYGYIYRFTTNASRNKAYKNMAASTATGISKYFFPTKK